MSADVALLGGGEVQDEQQQENPIGRKRLNEYHSFEQYAGWAYMMSVRSLWRVKRSYDLDDLMGEARSTFVKVCRHYPDIKNLAHFCALFKTAFTNRIHRLALAEFKHRAGYGLPESLLSRRDDEPGGALFDRFVSPTNGSEMSDQILRLKDAPPPVLRLLRRLEKRQYLIPTHPKTGQIMIAGYRQADQQLKTKLLNEWLCVIAGVPAGTDVIAMVHQWCSGGKTV